MCPPIMCSYNPFRDVYVLKIKLFHSQRRRRAERKIRNGWRVLAKSTFLYNAEKGAN